jgi:predicted nucleic acid-binding protein
MSYFTYDTSVIISRRVVSLRELSGSFRLATIVLMELMASARDDSQRKAYEDLFRAYQKESLLIVPNEDDWLLASKVLYWLTQSRRRTSAGKLHRLDKGVSQRMALDALLATSARRYKVGVVTENWKDFKLIQRFCNVKVWKAAEFFSA